MSEPRNPEALIEKVHEKVAKAAACRDDNEAHHGYCDDAAYAIIEYLATAPVIYQDVVASMARLVHHEAEHEQAGNWWYS